MRKPLPELTGKKYSHDRITKTDLEGVLGSENICVICGPKPECMGSAEATTGYKFHSVFGTTKCPDKVDENVVLNGLINNIIENTKHDIILRMGFGKLDRMVSKNDY